jgi:hypothetical protein
VTGAGAFAVLRRGGCVCANGHPAQSGPPDAAAQRGNEAMPPDTDPAARDDRASSPGRRWFAGALLAALLYGAWEAALRFFPAI